MAIVVRFVVVIVLLAEDFKCSFWRRVKRKVDVPNLSHRNDYVFAILTKKVPLSLAGG